MSAIESFRQETREWLAENCPAGARGPGQIPWGSTRMHLEDDARTWLERMAGRGWTVPTWPRQYGGAELTPAQYLVLLEELRRIDARSPLTGRGVNYIGPTLLDYGTPEQKARWLPGIARGEGGWCMGYSEPGAGSDLANLSTRAVLDGDRYVINGRKTWTSDAMESDYIFALVRTDPVAPKHDGISLMLIDMHQSGVQVRPIRLDQRQLAVQRDAVRERDCATRRRRWAAESGVDRRQAPVAVRTLDARRHQHFGNSGARGRDTPFRYRQIATLASATVASPTTTIEPR